jgi:hypothetical protein
MMTDLDETRAFVDELPTGRLTKANTTEVERRLSTCWHLLEGSEAGGMEGRKFLGRTENMEWEPPTLRFQLERHGGAVHGSSRAELQRWEIDLQVEIARIVDSSRRQLRQADPRLDVCAIAAEIASIVIEGRDDVRVQHRNGSVTILTADIIPLTNKQTTADRRKRFIQRLEQLLAAQGWRRRRAGRHPIFERQIPG